MAEITSFYNKSPKSGNRSSSREAEAGPWLVPTCFLLTPLSGPLPRARPLGRGAGQRGHGQQCGSIPGFPPFSAALPPRPSATLGPCGQPTNAATLSPQAHCASGNCGHPLGSPHHGLGHQEHPRPLILAAQDSQAPPGPERPLNFMGALA